MKTHFAALDDFSEEVVNYLTIQKTIRNLMRTVESCVH